MDTHLSMLYLDHQKSTFEQKSMFQRRGNHHLKGATIKGKNMLPIGSRFFPLKVAPMRIDTNFKGHSI